MPAVRMMFGLSVAGILYASFAPGGGASTDTFSTPPETALMRLEARHRVVNGTGLGSLTITGRNRHANVVLVTIERAGDQHRLECHVTVSPASSGGSSTSTDCTQPATNPRPAAKLAIQAFNIVMREHVAATVEDRPYDVDSVADKMLAFISVAGPMMAAAGELNPGR